MATNSMPCRLRPRRQDAQPLLKDRYDPATFDQTTLVTTTALTRDQQYSEHAAAVERYLASKFGRAFNRHDREDLRQDAFLALERQRARGEPIRSEEAVLIRCARNAAFDRLKATNRRKDHPVDPLDSAASRAPDPALPTDAAVMKADEERRVRLLVDQLDIRAREILKLRLEHELEGPEIAERLGLSVSHAYRLLRQAGAALSVLIEETEAGVYSRRQRSLLAACVLGIASARQRAQAERLLDDPHARATLAELKGLSHKAAATIPAPAVTTAAEHSRRLEDVWAPVAHAARTAKDHALALVDRTPGKETLSQMLPASGGGRTAAIVSIAALCTGGTAVGVQQCIHNDLPHKLYDSLSSAEADAGDPPSPSVQPSDNPNGGGSALTSDPAFPAPEVTVNPAPPDPSPPPAPVQDEPTPAPATASDAVSGLGSSAAATPAPVVPPPPSTASSGTSSGSSSSSQGAATAGSTSTSAPPFGGGL